MVKQLLLFEWKKMRRSSYFQKNLALSILFVIFALYMIASVTVIGLAAYFGTKEESPSENPLTLINNYLIFWFLLDLIYRFFFQKLPFMDVKPLMLLPIGRKKIIHYLLLKSTFSIFNFIPFFFFVPFTVAALIDGQSWMQIVPWCLAMLALEVTISFLIFLINKSNYVFYLVSLFLILIVGLYYFEIVDIAKFAGKGFNGIYQFPFLALIPVGLVFFVYRKNATLLRKSFYLDDKISVKKKEALTSELKWLDYMGTMSIFLKNDVRLILRNTRTKQVLMFSAFFLFYGLLIFTNDVYGNSPILLIMFSTFITGGFMMTFGQSVPAWDSEYYKLLMSQNISYYRYLESKWWLLVVSVLASLILSLPYLLMGVRYYEYIFATAMFNIGANSYINLIGGVYNKTRIKLNEKAKAFGNTQNFSFTQILIAMPKIFGPVIIFYPFYQFFNFEIGILALSIFGMIGWLLKKPILKQIEKIYQDEKYETIQAFSEE